MKYCPDCLEHPAPDQRPPNPGKKKDGRCPKCKRELKDHRYKEGPQP